MATIKCINHLSSLQRVAIEDLEEATVDSVAYRLARMEQHLFGICNVISSDGSTGFELNGFTPWRLTAGSAEAWGAWVQIADGTELAHPFGEPDQIIVDARSANVKYIIQMAYGESGSEEVFSSVHYHGLGAQRTSSVPSPCPPIDATEKRWARCKSKTNGATIDVRFSARSYPG